MKKLIVILSIATLITSCESTKKVNTTTEDTKEVLAVATPQKPKPPVPAEVTTKTKTMLVGKEDRSALEQAPFASWYTTNYKRYTPDTAQLPALEKALEGITITTFMGTWCSDSKRETPRMFKILDQASFNQDDLELITVDRSKKKPLAYTAGNDIIRVPTFIFKRNGEEIGRIVENPIESLEADMIKILNGEPYKHAYEN